MHDNKMAILLPTSTSRLYVIALTALFFRRQEMNFLRILTAVLISSILIVGCGDDGSLDGVAHPEIRLLLAPGAQHAEITRVVPRDHDRRNRRGSRACA